MIENVSIRNLKDGEFARWNEYVLGHADGTMFHLAGWADVFVESLGHKAHYKLAERDGKICGILPAVQIRSRLFGHTLTSLPFLAYGGILASDSGALSALENDLVETATSLGVDFIEIRDREQTLEGWEVKDSYVTFRKEIPDTPEECLKMIPRKQRAMVRKGIGHDLVSRIDTDLNAFYAIMSESYRNLGTPILPRRYFEKIHKDFGDDCEILTITKDDVPVATVMSYYYKNEVIPYYGGSRSQARSLMANDFMYWELMRRASERGLKVFDYGRSRKGTGSYRFKRHWGFEPEPLHYQYRLIRQSELPNVSPSNPKYEMAISIWRKLPVRLTQLLGPLLARGLPG